MQNEIDAALEAEVARRAATLGIQTDLVGDRSRVARLAARLYASASTVQRSRIVTGLLRPLGPLALVAVASGAFAGLLNRVSTRGGGLTVDDLASFTNGQIFELARFVEQVSPDALHQVAGAIAENPFGVSAFGAAAAVLLVNALRGNAQ
jgi:hypothetical protein